MHRLTTSKRSKWHPWHQDKRPVMGGEGDCLPPPEDRNSLSLPCSWQETHSLRLVADRHLPAARDKLLYRPRQPLPSVNALECRAEQPGLPRSWYPSQDAPCQTTNLPTLSCVADVQLGRFKNRYILTETPSRCRTQDWSPSAVSAPGRCVRSARRTASAGSGGCWCTSAASPKRSETPPTSTAAHPAPDNVPRDPGAHDLAPRTGPIARARHTLEAAPRVG